LESARKKLILIESHNAKRYFNQIFSLFPESIRPEGRTGYKAYDGLNNVFNFGYYVLKCRVHKALLKAKLEPYLGFLHSEQFGKPSSVCDFQELYRYLIDDFVIQYCQRLVKRDFTFKTEKMSAQKKGKREYLNDAQTKDFTAKLNDYFETQVEIPRTKVGNRQTIETLINEEALLFAKYLRNEKKDWLPRIGIVESNMTN
jgi:CRISPR-associated protein Cas1